MVLCWIALPILAFLGLFSLKYRKLAKESLECFFRTITLRKCQSTLDERIKTSITGNVMKVSPKTARIIYKNYVIFSWIFVILMIWSSYVSTVGIYNYVQYGNCNGPDSDGFCILDPTGENSGTCAVESSIGTGNITYPKLNTNRPIIGNKEANLTIIEFGCYVCPYTNKAEETVEEVLDYYEGKVNLQFISYPLPGHKYSYESSLAAKCAEEQRSYENYHKKLV